jgi:hypothetical protein
MKTTIRLAGKTSVVHTRTVGQCFGSMAFARVGGRKFESETKPLGMTGPAIEQVTEMVLRAHPTARVVETD